MSEPRCHRCKLPGRLFGLVEIHADGPAHADENHCIDELKFQLGETREQLDAICRGVNRRCGCPPQHLPLVSLDRMIDDSKRDRALLLAQNDQLRELIKFCCIGQAPDHVMTLWRQVNGYNTIEPNDSTTPPPASSPTTHDS